VNACFCCVRFSFYRATLSIHGILVMGLCPSVRRKSVFVFVNRGPGLFAVLMLWMCCEKMMMIGRRNCMEYEVEGPRPRRRPKRTWREVVREDCQARKLNKEDAPGSL